jgi:outer membrane protein OmpA-like peptidoglycan-associated protein
MTTNSVVRGSVKAVVLSCALAILLAGPAQAVDYDVTHLPTFDPKTLASSIDIISLENSVEDLETTSHSSGETVVTLNADILFAFGKAALPPAAPARIAASVAKTPKGSAVSIGGHTDEVGGDAANLTLSKARAQAVAAAVKVARPDLVLKVEGFGESKPVGPNSDEAGRSKNRRVEIRFSG